MNERLLSQRDAMSRNKKQVYWKYPMPWVKFSCEASMEAEERHDEI